ncbi:MAG: aminotransferase class III-fold pyridoxal phosphate-dependent enzyme [Luteitalea sp.]|nr:aminotransferase class III-fold pyridoxal phosphate-dependent enzyme [Luteitalea sp.]
MTSSLALHRERRERSIRARTPGSMARHARSARTLAGGVSSAVRRSARPYPLFFTSGAGPRVDDVDGNSYIDYGLAWGPLILGHSHPAITSALHRQLDRELTFGAQHDLEYAVSELLVGIVPCGDLVTFASSGTEIVQVALRLARAVTGRSRFLKFEGHYHGWDDSVLVSYHPSAAEIGAAEGAPIPVAAGQRRHDSVIVAEWNDRTAVERAIATHGSEISAIICEPILCNSGCIPPDPGFLEFLREITLQAGALLIFDEVITGFRLKLDGAQGFYDVTPDLATYAKAIGGGVALSALAGRRDFMHWIANGRVVHAGTLNGNPLALAGAKATLEHLSKDAAAIYTNLHRLGDRLREGLEQALSAHGYPVVTSGAGPVFQVSFMDCPARCYRDLLRADTPLYNDFAMALLDEGVLVLPDGRWYVSTVHTDEVIDETLAAIHRAVA